MTIKKLSKVSKPTVSMAPVAGSPAASEPPSVGGATIAERFKLDAPAPKPVPKAAGISATIAACAGLAALGVVGVLTFILWQHWGFLQGA